MLGTDVCKDGNCRFNQYQIGGLDSSGRKIEQIVYFEPNRYIIYFVEGEYLRPYYTDSYDFKAPFSAEFQKKLSEVMSLNVRNEKQNEFMRQEIASAYYNALNQYSEVALGELEVLKNKLTYRAYAWWFTIYVVLGALMTILSVTVHYLELQTDIREVIYCMTSSCIGGLLVHTRKEYKLGIATFLPAIAAYICFFASIGSGFLVYCVLKSNLILGGYGNDTITIILICFIAGYSEDIPLKLIDKVSNVFGGSQMKEKQ